MVGRIRFALERSDSPRHRSHVAQLFSLGIIRAMNFLANPKSSMWLCRIVPAVTWVLWLVALLSYDHLHDGLTVSGVLFFVSLIIYLPLVYFVLPVFLFGGTSQSVARKVGYFIFTGVTAGIGPVVWYFVSVDGALRRMAANRR